VYSLENPTASVWPYLDQVLMLSRGQQIFQGGAETVISKLLTECNMALEISAGSTGMYSEAEYLIDVIQVEKKGAGGANVDKWQRNRIIAHLMLGWQESQIPVIEQLRKDTAIAPMATASEPEIARRASVTVSSSIMQAPLALALLVWRSLAGPGVLFAWLSGTRTSVTATMLKMNAEDKMYVRAAAYIMTGALAKSGLAQLADHALYDSLEHFASMAVMYNFCFFLGVASLMLVAVDAPKYLYIQFFERSRMMYGILPGYLWVASRVMIANAIDMPILGTLYWLCAENHPGDIWRFWAILAVFGACMGSFTLTVQAFFRPQKQGGAPGFYGFIVSIVLELTLGSLGIFPTALQCVATALEANIDLSNAPGASFDASGAPLPGVYNLEAQKAKTQMMSNLLYMFFHLLAHQPILMFALWMKAASGYVAARDDRAMPKGVDEQIVYPKNSDPLKRGNTTTIAAQKRAETDSAKTPLLAQEKGKYGTM